MNVLVTGASSGLGRAVSEELVRAGHMVWGLARRREMLEELSHTLGKNSFLYSICDVTRENDVERVIGEMSQHMFHPDVVIANAGTFPHDKIFPDDYKKFRESFAVHFIAISSIAAFRPNARGVGYSASKAALGMTFRGLDLMYRKRGIVFSTVYLGPVATTLWEGRRSFLIPNASTCAKDIIRIMKTRKSIYYLPFLSTFLFRISLLLPDRIYTRLSTLFFK
jgi:short-subunit dehydrogenase